MFSGAGGGGGVRWGGKWKRCEAGPPACLFLLGGVEDPAVWAAAGVGGVSDLGEVLAGAVKGSAGVASLARATMSWVTESVALNQAISTLSV